MRLIRSKGVGVFFVTQTPKDIPADVLGQLGNRVQHALRAFTPDDAKALKATVSTFPKSDFYDLEELLTSLGIGEAAVTILSESGVPTPVVHTRCGRRARAWRRPTTSTAPRRHRRSGPSTGPAPTRRARARCWRRGSSSRRRSPQSEPEAEVRSPSPRRPSDGAAPSGGPTSSATSSNSRQGKALERKVVRGVFGMLKKRL